MNGEHFLIYTEQVGGLFHVCKSTPEAYAAVCELRQIMTHPELDTPVYIEPAFVALVEVSENYDFILGRPR